MASAANKLRDFGIRVIKHWTTMSLGIRRAVPHQFTSVQHKLWQFGATLPPAFCMFVFYEQKCVEPTCERILPPEVQSCLRSPVINNGVGKCLHQIACPREESHCNLDATLFLAWCLHEVRLRRCRFTAAVYRVASCVSTVRLTTCRNEHNHVVKVAF